MGWLLLLIKFAIFAQFDGSILGRAEIATMADIPNDEFIEELEAIRVSILTMEQYVVPPVTESEARRKVERLISLIQLANL